MNTHKGTFITIEGLEGAGKSTVIKVIENYLHLQNVDLVVSREPGGTPVGEAIRDVILSYHDDGVSEDAELLLYFASRAQHIARLIRPALNEGKIVLCDRFTDASYAYQCGGRGIDESRIKILEDWVQQGLQPDLTLFLDLPVEMGLSRIRGRGTLDRMESEEIAFFERVKQHYYKRIEEFPERFRVFDASLSLEEVKQNMLIFLENEIYPVIHPHEQ